MVIREFDVQLSDGRTLHAYDTGEADRNDRLTAVWHHGTPNIGPPPEPLFPAAERLGSDQRRRPPPAPRRGRSP